MSLRILLCTHAVSDVRAAVYRSLVTRAKYIRSQGHQVDELNPNDLMARRPARLDPFLLPILVAIRRLSHYDVIVFHSYLGWAYNLLPAWFGRRSRIVTITSFHGLEPLYFDALAREATRSGRRLSWRFRFLHAVLARLLKLSCRRSNAVFCLNSREAEYLTRHSWANAERVYIMPNGVEAECFVERESRASARRLLFVGQWLPGKGIRYLVDAFAALASEFDVELACVGTRAPTETVLASFPEAVRTRVTVVPDVDRSELCRQLSRADLFVFPSLSEGFSLALLEAMAAGLPIVATPAGAATDILIDGCNALVVPLADADAIVSAVRRIVGDARLREQLGRAARATAANYTFEASAARLLATVSAVAHAAPSRDVNTRHSDEDLVA
jgi:glycosyltransferase involved in cell wall biosynthesis